ncbi:C4-dicarboxylate TRAP transporter substrate-binding protein [Aminobacter aganoensis]|uniref:TRAP-type C4-dicarboxylate transport system substrate-binding protein n=1 Tax=Aminobacter aganoensis TaxID=83264 RepID=A0A7X0F6T6_9HYPH|nr:MULTISPECIES: C4-dicarboxylate TRAP transporter substrate-binding protein [Aminobacter]KQU64223.1 C4-dicarboxylate ABC transporter substrate-binding protein [Aminobacter sp. DSM 101952]MBB6354232.1 TRAP-type C4-dicarboxylate transport system substrate-binding protein [Aminobacter aganoensis]
MKKMIACSLGLALGMFAASAQAVETVRLTMASSHPTSVAWVGALKSHVVDNSNRLLEEQGSNYRIEWTEAFGGALYDFNDSLEAIESGMADMGWVGSLWEPAKMPLQNITFATPFVTSDPAIAVDVLNELNDTVPEMKAEWTRHNLVFLGASVNDTYHIFTKFPVNSLADLKGKKIVGNSSLGPWLEGTGAVLVAGGLPSFYQQIQSGVADGAIIMPTGSFSLKLHEVAPHITLVDIGVTTVGGLAVNQDSWNALPKDVQAVLTKLGREYSDVHAKQVMARYDQSLADMAKEGAQIKPLPAQDRQLWVDSLAALSKTWVETAEKAGLPARDIVVRFMDEMRERGAKPLRNWDQEL